MRNLLVLLAVILAASCSKKGDGGESKAAAEPAASAPVEPFAGELSEELLKEAKGKIEPRMQWSDAEALLVATVGKATAVIDGRHYWAFVDGDKCVNLVVEERDGQVGIVKFGSSDKIMKKMFTKCARGAGVETEGSGDSQAKGEGDTPPTGNAAGVVGGAGQPEPSADGTGLVAPKRKSRRGPGMNKSAPDGEDDDPAKLPD